MRFAISQTSPARTGYTFQGWCTNTNGKGEWFKVGDTISTTTNITLYAQWEESSGGGSTDDEDVVVIGGGSGSGNDIISANSGYMGFTMYGDTTQERNSIDGLV